MKIDAIGYPSDPPRFFRCSLCLFVYVCARVIWSSIRGLNKFCVFFRFAYSNQNQIGLLFAARLYTFNGTVLV